MSNTQVLVKGEELRSEVNEIIDRLSYSVKMVCVTNNWVKVSFKNELGVKQIHKNQIREMRKLGFEVSQIDFTQRFIEFERIDDDSEE